MFFKFKCCSSLFPIDFETNYFIFPDFIIDFEQLTIFSGGFFIIDFGLIISFFSSVILFLMNTYFT